MVRFHGEFLLIDNNTDFLNEIQKDGKHLNDYPLIIQKTLINGMRIFEKQKASIRVVVVNISFFLNEETLQNFKQSLADHPCLFISHKSEHPLKEIFESEGVLLQPKSYKTIIERFKTLLDNKPSWEQFEENNDKKFVEVSLNDADFISIPINNFIFLPKSHFNLYIRIGAGNFIKILNAGDNFENEVLERYSSKGFTDIHMPVEEHQKYVTLCEITSNKVIRSFDVAPEIKIKNVFRLGNEISKNLQKTGIEFPNLDYAETFLGQSLMLVKNLNMKDGNLKKFLKEIENNEHSTTVSFLSGIVANGLGFESSKSIKLVGLASLVHDIGLQQLAPGVNESELSADDEIFIKHSKHGADFLRKTGNFDEVVCLAVEQHHLRRRASDPAERCHQMNLVAEIVGASDCFYNTVLVNGYDEQKLKYFLRCELVKFSHAIEKSFLKMIHNKKAA